VRVSSIIGGVFERRGEEKALTDVVLVDDVLRLGPLRYVRCLPQNLWVIVVLCSSGQHNYPSTRRSSDEATLLIMASLTDLEKSRPLEPTTVELRRLRSEQLVHVLVTSDTKPSEFRYQKLQSEENIRLLKYSYTGTSQEISYEIVEKRLAEISGQFVAMSYRWRAQCRRNPRHR